jgi:acyl-CoA thioesterase
MSDAGDATRIAQLSAEAMWAQDVATRSLGMRLDHVEPGAAVVSMKITATMVNGHGSCHGGYIFMLADSAFAFACNSFNQKNVAQHCQITFVAPGVPGMRLVAEARLRQRGERSGIYDVTVRSESGDIIAEFRGHSRAIPGTHVPEP